MEIGLGVFVGRPGADRVPRDVVLALPEFRAGEH